MVSTHSEKWLRLSLISIMVLTRTGAGIRLTAGLKAAVSTAVRPSKAAKRLMGAISNEVPPRKRGKRPHVSAAHTRLEPLLVLPEDCVIGTFQCRPSKRNRSPYVADVLLENENREVIVHVPNLDMGGKCVPGAKLLMKPARDRKGNLVGRNATSPKYGTPKCEFIAQLLHVDESLLGYEPAWVGAHPSLGEKVAEQLVGHNLLGATFPAVRSFEREVRNVGGTDMRADFLIQHEDAELPPRILEVKTVVDTDYSVNATPDRVKCVFTSDKEDYIRTAIFPWGQSNQKGPNGEKVVSARAIKHVNELTRASNDKNQNFDATVLFVIVRGDAKAFRPNYEACPTFARCLKEAECKGVQILAIQVFWVVEGNTARCYQGDLLDIDWSAVDS